MLALRQQALPCAVATVLVTSRIVSPTGILFVQNVAAATATQNALQRPRLAFLGMALVAVQLGLSFIPCLPVDDSLPFALSFFQV